MLSNIRAKCLLFAALMLFIYSYSQSNMAIHIYILFAEIKKKNILQHRLCEQQQSSLTLLYAG